MAINNQLKPEISVIIPTCNRPELLPRAIKSVLNQTFQDFEIIVVDDGDKISAEKAMAQFNDGRLKYIKHEKRQGGGAARNTGLRNSQGEYIAFLDDDDEYLPSKLKRLYGIMKEYETEADFVFCTVTNYYEKDNKVVTTKIDELGAFNYFNMLLAHQIRILTPATLIKKSALMDIGGFDENLPSNQEWDLMIRLSKKSKGYGINTSLVKVYIPTDGHINADFGRRIKGREMIINKHFADLKERPEVLANHYFWLGLFCRDNKQFKEARDYFKKAWQEKFKFLFFAHYLSMVFSGAVYKIIYKGI